MSTLKYIPPELQNDPLFDQVTFALDKIVADALETRQTFVQKYYDFPNLPPDLLEKIIKEWGYEYISNVLNLTPTQLANLTQVMSLIHALKGHKSGLLLVLTLLGFSGSTVVEWWEASPQDTPNTFTLSLNLNLSTIEAEAIPRLLQFIREYVYPVLALLEFISDVAELRIYGLGTADQIFTGTITDTVTI